MSQNSVLALLFLLLILAGVVFRVVFWPGIRERGILRKAFPDSWLSVIRRRLPFYANMPVEQQQQLQNLIKLFLHDKRFVGCAGQVIDDEIRVTVAAQACLLLLNRRTTGYQDLQSILVYPSTFVTTREIRDELGLVSNDRTAMLGESWEQGKVILAWDSVENGVLDPNDGYNVVLHEFAHQLDHESGASNGAPLLTSKGAYRSWAHVFSKEFEMLQKDVREGNRGLLDHYGATNPAEFFAVATEAFFERPIQMREGHLDLYRELVKFYRVDPASWY